MPFNVPNPSFCSNICPTTGTCLDVSLTGGEGHCTTVEEPICPTPSKPKTKYTCDSCIKLACAIVPCSEETKVGEVLTLSLLDYPHELPSEGGCEFYAISSSLNLSNVAIDTYGTTTFTASEAGVGKIIYKVVCGKLSAIGEILVCVPKEDIDCPTDILNGCPDVDLGDCADIDLGDTEVCPDIDLGSTCTPPAEPIVECYESTEYREDLCAWLVSGEQPPEPPVVNCWDIFEFDTTTCAWVNTGVEPAVPTMDCYQTASFNTQTCMWEVSGTQPVEPTTECYETSTFDTDSCAWVVTGTQPVKPEIECYETVSFNTTTCAWDVLGTQPTQPADTNTWDEWEFDSTTCAWVNVGVQPQPPTNIVELCNAPCGTNIIKATDFEDLMGTINAGMMVDDWYVDSGNFQVLDTSDPNYFTNRSGTCDDGNGNTIYSYPQAAQSGNVYVEIAASSASPKLDFTIPDGCDLDVTLSVYFANYAVCLPIYEDWDATVNIFNATDLTTPIASGNTIPFDNSVDANNWYASTVTTTLSPGNYTLEIFVGDFGAFDNINITYTKPC